MDEMYVKKCKEIIASLPSGNVTYKTINGKRYPYYQWMENGKQRSRVVKKDELDILLHNISMRKILLEKINKPYIDYYFEDSIYDFNSSILFGKELKEFVNSTKDFKKRDCYKNIKDYIYGNTIDKVFILYGLRRTGKTTLIKQVIFDMDEDEFNKTAFIQITSSSSLASLNKDLKKLKSLGYKYIFIDEVTLLDEFIEGSALFSDVYAALGMKIVLSGTDSLGFILTKSEQLYDRCILEHTTFIPYREFHSVLGISGIDEYIRYGGTMSLSGINYNHGFVFNNDKSVNDYIDSSIAHNIQHSLKYYNNGNHFRHLQELYENNELTNVINRVVEDINHRFTKDVLISEFKSNDLALSSRNLRMDKNNPSTILDDIDKDKVIKHLKTMLDILDVYEQKVPLNEIHATEIKEYLFLLDLIYEIDIKSLPISNDIKKNIVISQPGLRYAQAISLIDSLLLDEKFNDLSLQDKNNISSRILNEIKGRMMEDIILLETKLYYKDKQVFKLKFKVGEFDMVIFDPLTSSSEIFEIKHSKETHHSQYRFLVDEEKLNLTRFKYGEIKRRCVIYNGISHIENDIEYINVDEYLLFNEK